MEQKLTARCRLIKFSVRDSLNGEVTFQLKANLFTLTRKLSDSLNGLHCIPYNRPFQYATKSFEDKFLLSSIAIGSSNFQLFRKCQFDQLIHCHVIACALSIVGIRTQLEMVGTFRSSILSILGKIWVLTTEGGTVFIKGRPRTNGAFSAENFIISRWYLLFHCRFILARLYVYVQPNAWRQSCKRERG